MTEIYLASCTKANEHQIGKTLAQKAVLDTFGVHAELSHDEKGRPILLQNECKDIYVSISHSHGLCLAAVSDEMIGADIEYILDRGNKLVALASRFFTAEEHEYVKGNPLQRFYEIWTAKESYQKYTGMGFSLPMSSFSVLEHKLAFTHFLHEGYYITICSGKPIRTTPKLIKI